MCLLTFSKNTKVGKIIPLSYKESKNSALEILVDKIRTTHKALSASPLNFNEKLIDQNQDTILLWDIVQDKPKLIFRFNHLACGTCINSELNRLEKLINEENKNDIVVLCHFSDIKDFFIFLAKGRYKLTIYNSIEYSLIKGLDELSLPFFFILDNKMIQRDLYIPDVLFPELSDSYLTNSLRYILECK